ncbi:MAG TPA: ATP-binding protein [Ferruginibacter sp.]|nr:ATP-binding protein [Ferruginibacter sp.]
MDAEQTKIYTSVIIAALIIGAILVFFIVSLIQQQKRNNRLYKSKILAEITTQENERARVAADLHDELGPLLFTVKFKLSNIDTNPEDQQALEEAGVHVDDIIQRIREISNDLMPGTLLRKGVIYAIDEFIDRMSKTSTLKVLFTHEDIPEISNTASINIYRIVLEIIHNTLKHANASLLKLNLSQEADKLILLSEDNGVGFNYSTERSENTGLGLRNLLNRTELMGGEMFVESAPGKGTKYTVELPILKLIKS